MTLKSYLSGKLYIFNTLTRAYSLPISVMSWLVPFIYALFNKGNIIYGIISLIGIMILHLATNLFDDIIDYYREFSDIKKGIKADFNFQKGKCICILEKKLTLKQALFVNFILFFIAFIICIFFLYIAGCKLLFVVVPSVILCLLYPVLGCLGFGEIIVAVIFSPLIYSGVYYVMTMNFSLEILMLSLSTGLLCVAVLFNHSLLDYKYDTSNRKITLCSLCSSEKKALIVLLFIVLAAYLNIIFWILKGYLSIIFLLPVITLPFALKLVKEMSIYIKQDKTPDNAQIFLEKFMLAQNLQKYFIIVLCLSIILSYWFKF